MVVPSEIVTPIRLSPRSGGSRTALPIADSLLPLWIKHGGGDLWTADSAYCMLYCIDHRVSRCGGEGPPRVVLLRSNPSSRSLRPHDDPYSQPCIVVHLFVCSLRSSCNDGAAKSWRARKEKVSSIGIRLKTQITKYISVAESAPLYRSHSIQARLARYGQNASSAADFCSFLTPRMLSE